MSIASLSEDAYKRTIVINGVSKTYSMTGWRIGYAAASEEIVKLMSNIQSHTTSNPNSIAQYASLEALAGTQEFIQVMKQEFKNRRDYIVTRINGIDNISCIEPKGAFYVFIDISKIIGKAIEGETIESSLDFCSKLLEKGKVAAVPGEAFGIDGFIRISYATSMENIQEGLNRIENCLKICI
ncbi:Aspartate aminotransferase [bioreactor metagenome]|uniref:Aspartate aminotransferase n=1 Tax=bioreactor metagenome TaxID=1076179 RepID=A0A645G3P0_9ZZZZ